MEVFVQIFGVNCSAVQSSTDILGDLSTFTIHLFGGSSQI